MRRLLIAEMGILAMAAVVSEVTMRPSGKDRTVLYAVYVVTAVLTALAYRAIVRLTGKARSLQHLIGWASGASIVVMGVAVSLGAVTMFLSPHDRDLLIVVLALGVSLAASLALAVSRSLKADLARIRVAADHFADGDRSARAHVVRVDEIGAVSEAFDRMAAQVEAAEVERQLFLSGVGHDLRTPLASLRAAIEAIQDGVVTDSSAYLAGMALDVHHLTKLVEDFFLLSRLEAGRYEPDREWINLMELADETIEALAPLALEADVHLRASGDVEAVVLADALSLGRVIRNLVENAIRHSPERGNVTIEVGGGWIRVKDEGPGFDPAAKTRAFERFYSGDPSRSRPGGAGLGLAIARGIVEAHAGSIEIDQVSGGSVTVRF